MKTLNDRPHVQPGSPWSFPTCIVENLSTGLTVVRVPMPGQHIITMEIGLDPPVSRGWPDSSSAPPTSRPHLTTTPHSPRRWNRSGPVTTGRPG